MYIMPEQNDLSEPLSMFVDANIFLIFIIFFLLKKILDLWY